MGKLVAYFAYFCFIVFSLSSCASYDMYLYFVSVHFSHIYFVLEGSIVSCLFSLLCYLVDLNSLFNQFYAYKIYLNNIIVGFDLRYKNKNAKRL